MHPDRHLRALPIVLIAFACAVAPGVERALGAAESPTSQEQAQARELIDQGKALYRDRRFEEAVKLWTRAAKMDPYNEEIFDLIHHTIANPDYPPLPADPATAPTLRPGAPPRAAASDFAPVAEEIRTHLDRMTSETQTKKTELEESLRSRPLIESRDTYVRRHHEQAKRFLAEGLYEQAAGEWERLIVLLPEGSGIAERVRQLKSDARDLKALQAKLAVKEEPLDAEQIRSVESEAGKALEEIRGQADLAKARAEAAEAEIASRRAFVKTALDRGSEAHRAGRTAEAVEEWKKILPHVEDGARLRVLLSELETTRRAAEDAAQAAADAERQEKTGLLDFPKELDDLLVKALNEARLSASESQARQARAAASIRAKEEAVRTDFETGRSHYLQGRPVEALAAWRGMAARVTASDELTGTLDRLDAVLNESRAAREAASAEETRERAYRVVPPADLDVTLAALEKELQKQTADAASRRAGAEKRLADRLGETSGLLKNAEEAYRGGRLPEALDFWKRALPNLEGGERYQDLIGKLETAAREGKAAVQAADLAEADAASQKAEVPLAFENLLNETDHKIKAQIEASEAREAKARASLAEKQAFVQGAYEKGLALERAGEMREAIDAWKEILPYVDESVHLREMLKNLEIHQASAVKAAELATQAEAYAKTYRVDPSGDMIRFLQVAEQGLQAKITEYAAQEGEARKQVESRKSWVTSHFEQGRAAYDRGDLKTAAAIWTGLLPYLAADEPLKARIAAVDLNLKRLEEAEKKLEDAQARQSRKLPVPPELVRHLEDASRALEASVTDAYAKTETAEKSLAAKKDSVNFTFLDGMILYEKGQYDEAFRVWESMTPHLEEGSKIKQMIEEYKLRAAQSAAVRKGRK